MPKFGHVNGIIKCFAVAAVLYVVRDLNGVVLDTVVSCCNGMEAGSSILFVLVVEVSFFFHCNRRCYFKLFFLCEEEGVILNLMDFSTIV